MGVALYRDFANPDIASVRNAHRIVDRFEQLGANKDRLRVLLNRMSEQNQIGPKQIETTLGHSLHMMFPSDYSVVSAAMWIAARPRSSRSPSTFPPANWVETSTAPWWYSRATPGTAKSAPFVGEGPVSQAIPRCCGEVK